MQPQRIDLVVGEHVEGQLLAALASVTIEQLRDKVRRAKASKLLYRRKDLVADFDDHARAFGFGTPEDYAEAARNVVRTSSRILVQDYKGELQLLFFGSEGYVVVDSARRLRGYFEHLKHGAVDKVFENLRKGMLWLRIISTR